MNQDIKYMHLLKFFMIEKEDIYNLYQHWSKSKINRYLLKKDVDILTFDSTLIGIEKADYLDLIIDYFLEE
jgi:6-phosphogluconate dehydrogenase